MKPKQQQEDLSPGNIHNKLRNAHSFFFNSIYFDDVEIAWFDNTQESLHQKTTREIAYCMFS
jgi:hypothetical protein